MCHSDINSAKTCRISRTKACLAQSGVYFGQISRSNTHYKSRKNIWLEGPSVASKHLVLLSFSRKLATWLFPTKKKPSQVTINNQSGITRQRTNISPRKLHQTMRKNWLVVIINNRKALIKFQESRISKIVSSTMYTAVFVFPHWLLQCTRSQTHGHLLGCFFLMSTKRKRRPQVGSSEGDSSNKTPAGMLFHPYA